jgi:hypothetical protein
MRNVRVLTVALSILTITFLPMPAKSLPSQGTCGSTCSVWSEDGFPYSSCDPGGGNWASCTAIIHCDRDENGHWVNCEGQCQGSQCYWV